MKVKAFNKQTYMLKDYFCNFRTIFRIVTKTGKVVSTHNQKSVYECIQMLKNKMYIITGFFLPFLFRNKFHLENMVF